MLDAGPLAAALLERPAAKSLIQPWILEDDVATSIVAIGEVVEYLLGWRDGELRARALRDVALAVVPLPVTVPIFIRYAVLRRQLRPPFGPGLIGDIDTIVAATALEHDLTLVSSDSDFLRVPDLKLVLLDRRTFTPIDRTSLL